MSIETFHRLFQEKELKDALKTFENLSTEDKLGIFSDLFQKSRYQLKPHSVSVLIRELHPDKQFDNFYQAWLPDKQYTHPVQVNSQTFQQFFEAPVRVLNGQHMQNPREIVSVGLHWTTDEQVQSALAESEQRRNTHRRDAVAEVANKVSANIYRINTDDNLGTPF